ASCRPASSSNHDVCPSGWTALAGNASPCEHECGGERGSAMSVRVGREFLAIPGPTTVPDEVLRAMHRPAVDIYSGSLVPLTDSLLSDLSRRVRTQGRSYIYIANGHGAWVAALTNVLSKGDKILVLESGRFAVGWGDAAAGLGVDVEVLKGDWRRPARPAEGAGQVREDT